MRTTYSTTNLAIVSFVALASASTAAGVVDAALPFATTAFLPKTRHHLSTATRSVLEIRGGEDTTLTGEAENAVKEEKSLDEKVYAAMEKLGLSAPSVDESETSSEMECKDGICPMPGQESASDDQKDQDDQDDQDPVEMSDRIAKDMNVDSFMAMAAIGATSTIGDGNKRTYNESSARAMIQQELDLIAMIPEESETVTALVGEGFDVFMSRRALAFSENNLEDARAILLADQMDAEEEMKEEEEARAAASAAPPPLETDFAPMSASGSSDFEPMSASGSSLEPMAAEMRSSDFVEVKTNFDPTKLPASAPAPAAAPTRNFSDNGNSPQTPKAAKKEDVVFDATTEQIQELVLESPVPVLLDIYADWCGPCKALGPVLEDMAIKSGGMFRVVKINSDNERPLSQALGVKALPTIFGVNEGKIVHMFEGMPKSEEMMKNFMMGLFGAAPFSPPVTDDEKAKYEELTIKLIKTASSASFSFSARERLTDRVVTAMDKIVKDDKVVNAEDASRLIRTFLNNIINNPYDAKFRKINLENKVVKSKIGQSRSCLAVLRSVGYSKSGSEMWFKSDQKVINVAPLVVARDTIDNWIQRNRKEIAAAARKRKDELDRAQLVFEEEDEEEIEEEVEEIDPTVCKLMLRLDGKNKIHDAVLHKDDPLTKILDTLNVDMKEDEAQITCVAKRLVVKSNDKEAMAKTLEDHGLMPASTIVVKVGSSSKADTSNIKERAAGKKIRKTGSHTMQSIGVYAKDDNNKAELIDGGGGVMYEQELTDDEDEGEENDDGNKDAEETISKKNSEDKSDEAEESATVEE